MKEIDIIKHARGYMDMLSHGYNPITKEKYSANSDINNERLIKCFSFVTEILDRVIAEEETKENINSPAASAVSSDAPSEKEEYPLLYNPSSLVSEDVEGIDVVNTLIQKGVIKQGFHKNTNNN